MCLQMGRESGESPEGQQDPQAAAVEEGPQAEVAGGGNEVGSRKARRLELLDELVWTCRKWADVPPKKKDALLAFEGTLQVV